MAVVTTRTKPVLRPTDEVVNVTVSMTPGEARKLLYALRKYWDGEGCSWDGPMMAQLATALDMPRF